MDPCAGLKSAVRADYNNCGADLNAIQIGASGRGSRISFHLQGERICLELKSAPLVVMCHREC